MTTPIFIRTIIVTVGFFLTTLIFAQASDVERFSFTPYHSCKNPTQSPAAKVLNKTYRIYTDAGDWFVADINGDGWCDWIRGGYEAYRTDEDEPPMREFIYLGTPSGWREFAQSDAYKLIRKTRSRKVNGLILPYVEAFNFYQPLLIYSSNGGAPYVVAVSRPDAPAPYPEISDINVMRWDVTFDMLRVVEKVDRAKIIEFVHNEICKRPQAYLDRGRELFITENLCKK